MSDNQQPPKCHGERIKNKPPIGKRRRSTLWSLPDLCLINIFQRFSFRDLYVAANVCTRFRRIAVSAFRSQHNQHYLCDESLNAATFVRSLRIFSPSRVRISGNSDRRIFAATAEYCANLESLSIGRSLMQPHELAVVRSLLPRLKEVSMVQMDDWHVDTDVDWQLERLHIRNYYSNSNTRMPGTLKLPKLRRLRFGMALGDFSDSSFFDFLATNGHIEQLQIYCGQMRLSQLHSLAECLPNLKALNFSDLTVTPYIRGHNIEPSVFGRLEAVKIGGCSDIQCLLSIVIGSPVKHLDLRIRGTEALGELARMTTVSRLTLRPSILTAEPVTVAHVLQIANAMRGVQVLHLCVGRGTTFKLGCIKRLIKLSNRITTLRIQWRQVHDFQCASKIEQIAALIAARPKLRVEVEVFNEMFFKVGRPRANGRIRNDFSLCSVIQQVPDTIQRQHAGWLKVTDIGNRNYDSFFFDEHDGA